MEQLPKRNIAYKLKIGDLLSGKPIIESEKLKYIELNNKKIIRANIIANIIDKYHQTGEKKFASITLDDGTGQIKIKSFGDETEKFLQLQQGETIITIGFVRQWNNEIYLAPEIIKKKDPLYLLLRKMEIEKDQPKIQNIAELSALKDKILNIVKDLEKEGGADIENIILDLKEPPEIINREIKRLLENGLIYEPRPGKIRWLG